jgi:hypothetical protein
MPLVDQRRRGRLPRSQGGERGQAGAGRKRGVELGVPISSRSVPSGRRQVTLRRCARTADILRCMPPMAVTMREIPSRMCGSRLVDCGQLDPGDLRLRQEIVAVSSRLRAWRLSPPAREDRPGRPRALRCGSKRAAREGGDCSLVACGREWKQLGSLICPRDARAPLQNGSCGTADQRSRPHPRRSAIFVVSSAITTGTPPRTRALRCGPEKRWRYPPCPAGPERHPAAWPHCSRL